MVVPPSPALWALAAASAFMMLSLRKESAISFWRASSAESLHAVNASRPAKANVSNKVFFMIGIILVEDWPRSAAEDDYGGDFVVVMLILLKAEKAAIWQPFLIL
jgi:hypothetical protein